ncbi:hypothetical protein Kpol_1028p26 [Vanderwaltozyma polyspora DSM 70294]|uniref:Uncharacterized protein n=1 Tax=Vanderwaltozyma polyspora (strain ATCC 22028 / DSM 70294 / BCRC 21397 / CBS 2163 / NBRC 10782 / NRRL Y-8283 / UCD 57-17) TaxID=436907 RepID=A7TFZ6_VANPO|nr:uncharacterized protein Kpol_1028p26 [Vanderwaltozyma polyspora DSM 70294]EDO18753.1 hypothetical protein Kpol_1028p26 [Vanderwaltozyma polyspora DSM 70294]
MSRFIPLSKVINELVAKGKPQVIYSYKIRPLVRGGACTLSAVFFAYGVSFADWSWASSLDIFEQTKKDDELAKMSILDKAKFYGLTFSPFLLIIIPFTLSFASIVIASRVVSSVTYLPKVKGLPQQCQITRRSPITGRHITELRNLEDISRSAKIRVFTGKGPNGTDDKSSFIFTLFDSNNSIRYRWQRFFLLSRSGTFYENDSRIFDYLFGGDSIKMLEKLKREKEELNYTSQLEKNYKQDEELSQLNKQKFSKLSDMNSERAKIHSGSSKDVLKLMNKKN